MGGPNLEIFKFALYIFTPIATMRLSSLLFPSPHLPSPSIPQSTSYPNFHPSNHPLPPHSFLPDIYLLPLIPTLLSIFLPKTPRPSSPLPIKLTSPAPLHSLFRNQPRQPLCRPRFLAQTVRDAPHPLRARRGISRAGALESQTIEGS